MSVYSRDASDALAGVAIFVLTGSAITANSTNSGPTSEDLLNAAKDTANWILPAGNYSGNRLVAESEIGPQNVD